MQRAYKERESQDYRRTAQGKEREEEWEAQGGQQECGDNSTSNPRGVEPRNVGTRRVPTLARRRRAQLVALLVSFMINVLWLSLETIRMASERVRLRSQGSRVQDWQPKAAPSVAVLGPDATFSSLAASASSSSKQRGSMGADGNSSGIGAHEIDEVWRRFERSVEFPSSGICGEWPEAYERMHAQILAGELPPKYITFRASQGGFHENLLGLVASFVAALLSNRAFLIEPSANFSLGPALLQSRIDWALKEGVPVNVTARHRLDVKEGDVFLLRRLNLQTTDRHRQVSFPPKALEYFQSLAPATNVIVETNGGVLARIFTSQGPTRDALHAMGLRMPYAFGCIVRFLLRPSPEVMHLVRGPLLSIHNPGTQAVCVHARTADAIAWNLEDPGSPNAVGGPHPDVTAAGDSLLGCAKRIAQFWLPQRKPMRWLVLSDSQALGEALRTKYPGEVIGSGLTPQHVSLHGPSSLPSIVADWLLLSSCQLYVLTESAFAKTAVAFNLSPFFHVLFHVRGDQDGFKWRASCDGAKSSSLLEFSQLSGL